MEWQLCQKQVYWVELCRADRAKVYNTDRSGEVYNFLEDIVEAIPEGEMYVCRGTMGELYLVPRDRLASYDVDPDAIGTDWVRCRTVPNGSVYCCRHPMGQFVLDTPYGVMHGNRTGVSHGQGDWVLCLAERTPEGYRPQEDNCWVVNGKVFERTYRLIAAD